MSYISTITKKEVIKRTAKLAGKRIQDTEKVVNGIFTALRQIMLEG